MTSAEIRAVASDPSTSHAVLPSVMPSTASSRFSAPLVGCASSTVMKLRVVRPTTNGRKNTVRSRVEPRRLLRTSTASA
jgi:hypothetical protein